MHFTCVLVAVEDACKCASSQFSLREIGLLADTVNPALNASALAEKVYRIVFIEADKLVGHENDNDLELWIHDIRAANIILLL